MKHLVKGREGRGRRLIDWEERSEEAACYGLVTAHDLQSLPDSIRRRHSTGKCPPAKALY